MIPTLSQVCSLSSPFEKDIEDYAAGQCRAVEVWLTKLESYLESHTIEDVKRLFSENEMTAPVASFQGGLLTSQGEARKQHWEHFLKRLDLCRRLEILTLVIACDIHGPLSQQDIDRVGESLSQAAGEAGKRGLRLALEFQAPSAFGNNLQTAAMLIAETASPHLGICLDLFHYYVGPSKPEDLAHLNKDNLFHVQVCDIADTPREFATDAMRILPGDGDIDFSSVLQHLRRIDYQDHVSIELMNPRIWQISPLQFGEIGMTALRKMLGQAKTEE